MYSIFSYNLYRFFCTFVCLSSQLLHASESSWTSYLSTLVETTDSLPLRLILVAGLGMLMSLTPCIYPMIPITVGILQAQSSTSLLRNFSLALSYTIGIASTFALLGLTAAYTGHLFGSIMTKPVVIIPMVSLLVYLAGAMMGFYEMYTPSFLTNTSRAGGGSLVSAFIFGAASGTVASPCLSPGLILLLSIVTTLGNALLGFLLLFAFGVGLSIPLLIIGTCSSALNVLPRAGMWMIEIKKLLGLVMIGMCFYFLKPLISDTHLILLARITLAIIAGYYIYNARRYQATSWRTAGYAFASILTICSVGGGSLYQIVHAHKQPSITVSWHTDYAAAHAYAQQEHKLLFIDVTADYCSICKAIEKKFFFDEAVVHVLNKLIPVKIDAADTAQEDHQALLRTHHVRGTPEFLIIDPQTNSVIGRFGSELHDRSQAEFITLLQPYVS